MDFYTTIVLYIILTHAIELTFLHHISLRGRIQVFLGVCSPHPPELPDGRH